jgi:hypothetical protein
VASFPKAVLMPMLNNIYKIDKRLHDSPFRILLKKILSIKILSISATFRVWELRMKNQKPKILRVVFSSGVFYVIWGNSRKLR